MRKPSVAYFAGFFDGEGSISVQITGHSPSNRQQARLVVKVANTNYEILLCFKERFRGSLTESHSRRHKNWAPWGNWTITGFGAAAFLEMIESYVIVKKPQVELGLEFWRFKRLPRSERCSFGAPGPKGKICGQVRKPETLRLEAEFKERMHALNVKGRARRSWKPEIHPDLNVSGRIAP